MATTERRPGYRQDLREKAAKLYKPKAEGGKGMSVREVAHTMGVASNRAWQYLVDAEEQGLVKMRPRTGQRKEK